MRWKSSAESAARSRIEANLVVPALLTSPSIRPHFAAAASASFLQSSSFETSARTTIALPPALVHACAVSSASPALLPHRLARLLRRVHRGQLPGGDCLVALLARQKLRIGGRRAIDEIGGPVALGILDAGGHEGRAEHGDSDARLGDAEIVEERLA